MTGKNSLWFFIHVFVAGCLFLGLRPESEALIASVRRGDELAQARRYSDALDAYRQAAAQCAGCAAPHLRQGDIYVAQGRHAEAWSAYLSAQRLGGQSDALTAAQAQLYLAQGAPEWSMAMWRDLLARRPGRVDWWMLLAQACLAADDRRGAQEAFERALDGHIAAQQRQVVDERLGVLCLEMDAGCALAHFEAAVSGPDGALGARAQAFVVALRGQDDEPALFRAKLGQVLFERGDLVLAQRQFRDAVELEPAYVDAHAYLGYVSSLLGDTDAALDHLERAIALEPAWPLPYYFLGMHYARQGWWITARDVLVQAHDLAPANPAICAAVAETYLQAQNSYYAAAESWLHAAVDNAPDDVRFHLLLARFYVDYGIDPGVRGVAVAQVAVDLAPENSAAHETLGWALYLAGNPDLALEPLRRAQQLAPDEPRIAYRLGEVYRALGQSQKAVRFYQQAIDLDWYGVVGDKARRARASVQAGLTGG